MDVRTMEISVLGSVVVRHAGVEVELGPQLRRVLAALVVRHGSVVSIDRMVDAVWMGEPPDGAEGSIKTYLTRLRKAIDPDRAGLITFHQPGYVLSLNGHVLDSERFEADLEKAARLLRTADDEAAIGLLTTALGRWHGDAYAGFADEEWARPEAVRLEERRLEAAALLIEARLGIGDTERALAEAQSLAEAEPLRERPRELLMRALFSVGRQAEALREFAQFRDLLVEEAGLDPSAGLVELEGRIARGDPTLKGHVRALRGYELGERIGQGAHAVVHRATQPGIGREVAVKIIRSELADRPDFVRRFEQEAHVVATVEHPHVVPLYDYWREPGAAYLVMRLLRGGSVEDALRARGPFSQRAAADVLRDVGGALEAAHRKGVVHRDVRPANLLLDEEGAAYLADFGIALPAFTSDGAVVTSPAYAAPEMLRGEPTGVAADVLSLGVTTFELLTGRLPFADSDSRAELIRRQLNEPLPSARATRTDLPARIDDILARATAKTADDRHTTIAALVDELVDALTSATSRIGSTTDVHRSVEPANPYVGLLAFDEADADRFFGREALITELVETLTREPFVVTVGPSGSGKSSVVRAGLVPALRRGAIPGSDSWFVTTMVPGSDPIDALETSLLRVAVNPPASLRTQLREDGGLLRAIRRVLPDDNTHILVVIDQLEELFTMTAPDERDRFLTELAHAITANGTPLRVVATLRADHYDVPLRDPAFAELTTRGTVTVRPLTAGELERVVVQPAASVGVAVEPALVAELVAGVSETTAALPLLQFALTEAFESRVSDVMLASVHHQLGGLTGAVAARADRIVEAGGSADEAETRRIFGRLVTLGDGVEDTRRRALRSELGTGERTAWLLDAFVSARLLTLDRNDLTREPTVEVAHEALLRDWPRLRAWLAEDRDDLRSLRAIGAASDAWTAAGGDDGELARSGRLETAAELARRRPELFNDREAQWLTASQTAADGEIAARARAAERDRSQNRRLRQLLAVAAALVVIASAAAVVTVVLRNRAVTSERTAVAAVQDADIERLTALSAAGSTVGPDVAILLALEANRRRDDIGTESALQRAIATQPTVTGIFPSRLGPAERTIFSRDGRVGMTRDNERVQWFDPQTGDQLGRDYSASSGITRAAISGDGSVTALALDDGTIRFVDIDGTEVAAPSERIGTAFTLALDRRGERLMVTNDESTRIIDVAGGDVVSTYSVGDNSTILFDSEVDAALSDDGTYFVVEFYESSTEEVAGYDIVDAETGVRRERVETARQGADIPSSIEVTSLFLTGGDRLVVGHFDGRVQARYVGLTSDALELVGPVGAVVAVGASPDGSLAAAAADGSTYLWSADGAVFSAPLSLGGEVDEISFATNGVATASLKGAGVVVVDRSNPVTVDRRWPSTSAYDVNPFNHLYGKLSPQQAVQLRRLSDDEVVFERPFDDVFPAGPGQGFFSADGEWVLTTGPNPDDVLVVSEIAGDRRFGVDPNAAYQAAFGEVAITESAFVTFRPAVGGERVFVGIRDLAGGPVIAFWLESATNQIVAGPIEIDSFGPPLLLDDGRVVMGSPDSSITILPADLVGTPVLVADTEGYFVYDRDPASGLVLVAGRNGSVGLLDVDTARVRLLDSVSSVPTAGAFSPDGSRVVILAANTTSRDASGVQLLDVATGRLVGVPMPLYGTFVYQTAVSWSEDGTGVWLGTESGPTRFAADPASWREIACGVVHRELTPDEWRTFVSVTDPQISACT